LTLGLSALSEPEPLEEGLSALSAFSALSADEDGFFRALMDSFSGLAFEGVFFGSLAGVADHIPHDDEPSRLTFVRSFFADRTTAGVIIGGTIMGDTIKGGASGTAGGGGGTAGRGGGGTTSIISVAVVAVETLFDFLLLFGGDMSTISTISSS
jgi:hypothetical protein